MRAFGDYDPIRIQHQDPPEVIKALVDACQFPFKTFSTFTYRSTPRGTDLHELEHPELVAKFARYFINLAQASKGCVFPFVFFGTSRHRPHAHAIITSENPLPFDISEGRSATHETLFHRGDPIIRPLIRQIGRTQHLPFIPSMRGAFYQSNSHIQEPFATFTPSSRRRPRCPFPSSILQAFQGSQSIKGLELV